ncbi:unnamed protein product [Ectocarpus sp. 8 AP-2014]
MGSVFRFCSRMLPMRRQTAPSTLAFSVEVCFSLIGSRCVVARRGLKGGVGDVFLVSWRWCLRAWVRPRVFVASRGMDGRCPVLRLQTRKKPAVRNRLPELRCVVGTRASTTCFLPLPVPSHMQFTSI